MKWIGNQGHRICHIADYNFHQEKSCSQYKHGQESTFLSSVTTHCFNWTSKSYTWKKAFKGHSHIEMLSSPLPSKDHSCQRSLPRLTACKYKKQFLFYLQLAVAEKVTNRAISGTFQKGMRARTGKFMMKSDKNWVPLFKKFNVKGR